ncbi:MAG: PhzF family phenazine biosynthesis protein [Alphaproteobacteria bacterium]|nr:PhzF family phenazine biosynthesis protein [Alphaproteobacteria bacterium]
MSEPYIYYVANAFAPAAFGGNPAGVFPCAEGLSEEQMLAIAKQLNLVETVFVLPPSLDSADFRLRYFTPEKELPIAGHPTIAAWVVLAFVGMADPKRKDRYRQQTQNGIQEIALEVDRGNIRVLMQQASPQFRGEIKDRGRVAKIFSLGEEDLLPELPVESVDTGLGHIVFGVATLAALMKVRRNIEPLKELCKEFGASEAQIFCSQTYDPSLSLHTRNICPREGMEDPACGVGNSALLAYLMKNNYLRSTTAEIYAEQGHIENRPSIIYVRGTRAAKGELYQSHYELTRDSQSREAMEVMRVASLVKACQALQQASTMSL